MFPDTRTMARAAADRAAAVLRLPVETQGRGPRHVRHRQLPDRVRRRAGRPDPGRALGRRRRLPHGRVRGHRPRPSGQLPTVDPRADRASPPVPGPPTTSTGWPRPTGSASATPACWATTRSTCAAWASARTGTWPSTTLRWPTSTTDVDVKVVALDDGCRRQQVNEGHFATDADVPRAGRHRDHPRPAPGRDRPGRGARGPQGGAGPRRARRARSPPRARRPSSSARPTPPSCSTPTRPAALGPLNRHRHRPSGPPVDSGPRAGTRPRSTPSHRSRNG